MPTANTVVGWTVVAAVAAGYYWAMNIRKNKNKKSLGKQIGEVVEPLKIPKAKKTRKDAGGHSSGDNAKSAKGKKNKKQITKPEADVASDPVQKDTKADKEEIDDDKEFARQLHNAKTGTISAPKSQPGAKQKSVKQNRAQERTLAEASSDNATAPSSTTGGDADDDQSPINSPDLGATSQASPVTNGISDMLEQPAAGPSILRVTSPTNPSPPKKANTPSAPKAAEMTKKQRQNKKKAEEAKLAREEEEKERKVLMEKQRRTAREAEGRAARDGGTFMPANGPSTSAWTEGTPAATNGMKSTPTPFVKPLDTYDPASNSTASTGNPAPTTDASNTTANAAPALLDEEVYSQSELWGEQVAAEEARLKAMGLPFDYETHVKFHIEESIPWQKVMAKERKNKARKGNSSNEAANSDQQQAYGPPPRIADRGPGAKWSALGSFYDPNEEDEAVTDEQTEVKDSEWEVAP